MTPDACAARLAIIGSWPPPAGGVSIHTQRLSALLDSRGVAHVVYNATSDVGDGQRVIGVYSRRRSWLLSYLFTGRERAVYLFSSRLSAWIIGALLGRLRRKRLMLRLRNSLLIDWCARSWLRRALCAWTLRQMDAIVCVNRHLQEAAVQLGVDPARVYWSPGFLPPRPDEQERAGVAAQVWKFTQTHGPLIAANGKVDWYNSVDLYGLDMLVELAGRLHTDYPQLGVVVCFWEHRPAESEYLDKLRARRQLGVEQNILFNTQPGPLMPVLAASDVFVRPTASDGDANSIREAMYLGVPAVASDVVERPAGAHLFRDRDVDALETSVRAALTERPNRATRVPRLSDAEQRRIDGYLDLIVAFAGGSALPESLPSEAMPA